MSEQDLDECIQALLFEVGVMSKFLDIQHKQYAEIADKDPTQLGAFYSECAYSACNKTYAKVVEAAARVKALL